MLKGVGLGEVLMVELEDAELVHLLLCLIRTLIPYQGKRRLVHRLGHLQAHGRRAGCAFASERGSQNEFIVLPWKRNK